MAHGVMPNFPAACIKIIANILCKFFPLYIVDANIIYEGTGYSLITNLLILSYYFPFFLWPGRIQNCIEYVSFRFSSILLFISLKSLKFLISID